MIKTLNTSFGLCLISAAFCYVWLEAIRIWAEEYSYVVVNWRKMHMKLYIIFSNTKPWDKKKKKPKHKGSPVNLTLQS